MIIDNLRFENNGDRLRSLASITWEDCDRKTQEIYFETAEAFSNDLSSNPHSFLVACIMPALHFGEKRILIKTDEKICPELVDGLTNAMNWMRLWWYNPTKNIVKIETKGASAFVPKEKKNRAGFFFSGGIDALATLRANRIDYSMDHPGSIRDGLLVFGLEVNDPKAFGYLLGLASIIAKDAKLTLIPVYTNIRSLGPEEDMDFWGNFWVKEFMGAAFSSIAYAFTNRLTVISLSSDHDIPNIYPFSSHPLINYNYASSELRFKLEGISLSRFEKTKLISGWDVAIKHLRVCNKPETYRPDRLNCGECEKCVRTMLSLKALGVLEKSSAFPYHDITKDQIEKTGKLKKNTFFFWSQMIIPLKEKGYHELVRAVEKKIRQYHQDKKNSQWRKALIDPITEFDRKNLKGSLRMIKRQIYSKRIVK